MVAGQEFFSVRVATHSKFTGRSVCDGLQQETSQICSSERGQPSYNARRIVLGLGQVDTLLFVSPVQYVDEGVKQAQDI